MKINMKCQKNILLIIFGKIEKQHYVDKRKKVILRIKEKFWLKIALRIFKNISNYKTKINSNKQ
jgi:isocitrate/isopropylmalate dehydrogenase